MLTGAFAFERLVAIPAFRQSGAALASASGLRQRLGWLAWANLALALVSGAAWLVAVAAGMSGKPLGTTLSQGAVPIVLSRTRFGEDSLLRLALAVVLCLCLLVEGHRRWRDNRAIGWTALLLAAAMLASLAWAGHGAATPGLAGDLHLAADFVHVIAAGLWLGTLPPLILLLAEARRTRDAVWESIVAAATRRYSAMAIASVAILLAAGVVNTWFLAGTVPALVGTEYGRLLLAEIGLFAAMLIVIGDQWQRLQPWLRSIFSGSRRGFPRGAARNTLWRTIAQLGRNARVETGLGLGVLAIVGVLGTLPPALLSPRRNEKSAQRSGNLPSPPPAVAVEAHSTSKVKVPSVGWVSTETTCQLTAYVPRGSGFRPICSSAGLPCGMCALPRSTRCPASSRRTSNPPSLM
jgi:putative copper resistance protein D